MSLQCNAGSLCPVAEGLHPVSDHSILLGQAGGHTQSREYNSAQLPLKPTLLICMLIMSHGENRKGHLSFFLKAVYPLPLCRAVCVLVSQVFVVVDVVVVGFKLDLMNWMSLGMLYIAVHIYVRTCVYIYIYILCLLIIEIARGKVLDCFLVNSHENYIGEHDMGN